MVEGTQPGSRAVPSDRNLSRYDLFKMFTLVPTTELERDLPAWTTFDTPHAVLSRYQERTRSCSCFGMVRMADSSLPGEQWLRWLTSPRRRPEFFRAGSGLSLPVVAARF